MRDRRSGVRVLLGMLVLNILVPAAHASALDGWLTDFETARTLARRSGKPIFVVFRCEH